LLLESAPALGLVVGKIAVDLSSGLSIRRNDHESDWRARRLHQRANSEAKGYAPLFLNG
jgi:hypothetical protein